MSNLVALERARERQERKEDGRLGVEKPIQDGSNVRQWTIKGLSPKTVEVSREAARRSGMRLNSWIGRALEDAAQSVKTSGDTEKSITNEFNMLLIKEQLDKIRVQGEQLEHSVNTINAILLKLLAQKE